MAHCMAQRVSTRKSQNEAEQLMLFLNKIINSDSSKTLSQTLGYFLSNS